MRPDAPPRLPSSLRDGTIALLVLGTLALGIHGAVHWLDHAHRLADARLRAPLLALRLLALALVLAALGLAWRRRALLHTGARAPVGFALRGLASGLLLGWAAGSAAYVALDSDKTVVSSVFWSVLIGFVACWTLFALLAPGRLFSTRTRVVDLLSWNLLLVWVVSEVVVNAWAGLHPSPFLWDERSVASSVEARRLAPGALYLGARVNSRGYYDEEFVRSGGGGTRVVAVLADSFGVGVVPHAYNFTTVAEQALARLLPERSVALHNFGIAGVGMPEYAWLLEREVPAVAPDRVLLCVFVGNDFQSYTRRRGGYYAFQRFVVFDLLRRVADVAQGAAEGGALDAAPLAPGEPPAIPEPGLEPPTFEPEAFLQIEADRLAVTDARDDGVQALYARFFTALRAIHGSAGDRLRVVLIPDEFQVNDALWQQLLDRGEREAGSLVRDLPQRRILAWCAERGLDCLDLLPELRAAQAGAPVYALRDTHWNARGNRVAGEAIARFLARTLDVEPVEMPEVRSVELRE